MTCQTHKYQGSLQN